MLALAINSVRVPWDNGTVSHDFYHALLPKLAENGRVKGHSTLIHRQTEGCNCLYTKFCSAVYSLILYNTTSFCHAILQKCWKHFALRRLQWKTILSPPVPRPTPHLRPHDNPFFKRECGRDFKIKQTLNDLSQQWRKREKPKPAWISSEPVIGWCTTRWPHLGNGPTSQGSVNRKWR